MARARNLKPSFFTDDEIAALPPLARLLFAGLWCLADREGRLEDKPRRIKAEVLPYEMRADIHRLLNSLHDARFIVRYEHDGKQYIQIRQFAKHQNPHIKEPKSTIPAPGSPPTKHGAGTGQLPEIPASTGLIVDSGFLIPSSLIPDSGSPPPDSGLPQPAGTPAATGPPNAVVAKANDNGAVLNNSAKAKGAQATARDAGQRWESMAYVAATAKTLGMGRRPGEDDISWRDRVYSGVQEKIRIAHEQRHDH
jgi:hypothetical protein